MVIAWLHSFKRWFLLTTTLHNILLPLSKQVFACLHPWSRLFLTMQRWFIPDSYTLIKYGSRLPTTPPTDSSRLSPTTIKDGFRLNLVISCFQPLKSQVLFTVITLNHLFFNLCILTVHSLLYEWRMSLFYVFPPIMIFVHIQYIILLFTSAFPTPIFYFFVIMTW